MSTHVVERVHVATGSYQELDHWQVALRRHVDWRRLVLHIKHQKEVTQYEKNALLVF